VSEPGAPEVAGGRRSPQRLGGERVLVCVRPPGWVNESSGPLTDLLAWAERAEDLGFDGVFVGDRLLGEATQPDGSVVYGASMVDVTVVLAAIAARTTRVLLGPLVLVFPYRHPVQLAKAFGSLDAASGGRVVLGAGIGWNAREFAALGIPMAGRADRFEEAVPLVQELWSGRPVTHDGAAWQFADVQVQPRRRDQAVHRCGWRPSRPASRSTGSTPSRP
jgi:alkanesulfonate monooxygenase SsuD/methylene tetrahydromethanopterin reductase-like flavin-dependent oxidoreductase (luciferase family)